MKSTTLDLFQVIRNGEVELYYKNIDNYDINIRNVNGQSLLHESITYNQSEIALDLIERSIDVNIQDENGQSSLHLIGFHPIVEVAKKIIEKGGNLELQDLYGNTPLWYAVFNARGKYELVKLFITCNSNPISKNKAGRSPVDFAEQINDKILLNILKREEY